MADVDINVGEVKKTKRVNARQVLGVVASLAVKYVGIVAWALQGKFRQVGWSGEKDRGLHGELVAALSGQSRPN